MRRRGLAVLLVVPTTVALGDEPRPDSEPEDQITPQVALGEPAPPPLPAEGWMLDLDEHALIGVAVDSRIDPFEAPEITRIELHDLAVSTQATVPYVELVYGFVFDASLIEMTPMGDVLTIGTDTEPGLAMESLTVPAAGSWPLLAAAAVMASRRRPRSRQRGDA